MSYDASNDIEGVLFSSCDLKKRVKGIAKELDEYYGEKEVIAICILRGSAPFYCDLVREISFPVKFDFMAVSSYGAGSESSGVISIEKDLSSDIEGKNILIVEDILDTGNTLTKLCEELKKRNPADIKLCCLLDKPSRRTQNISADFVGFEIDDHFVVGYGLDFAGNYRQIPYIGILKPSVYNK